ncbi:glycosyltransferase [Aerococcus viridans]
MKLLFVHGDRLKEDINGNLYSGGSYNKNVWNRYTSVFNNVSFLAKKETTTYTVEYAKKKFNIFDKDEINFIEVHDSVSSISSFFNIKNRKKNNTIIEESVLNSDYIIARIPSEVSYKAIEYAKLHNKPYLVEVVGCAWDSLWNHSLKGKAVAPWSYLTMKKAVLDSKYAVYVTNNFLQKRYPTNGYSISASNVMLNSFNDKTLIERKKKIKQMEKSKKIIGTVAALNVKYKGQQYIIEALGHLKKEGNTNFEYHLVGDGDQTYLKSQAKKHNVESQVKFLGSIPHENIFRWLDTIDLYTQPSRQEGLPRALIEAMSRGLPSFGANTAGIPELLEEQFIFSNTKNNIREILQILDSLDNTTMLEQAEKNYNESKKYSKHFIEKRRKQFFNFFKENEFKQ